MGFYVKRFVLLLATVAMLAATSGCTISKKDCLQGDWQTRGYEDGKSGRSPDVIERYASKCAKHGVTPDAVAYSAGFDVGIELYCTADNGIKVGEKNETYTGACPADLEPVFLKNYLSGLRLALDDLEIKYDSDSLELDILRANRDRLAIAGKPHATDDKRIKTAVDSLRSNTSERSRINQNIRKWSAKL